MLLGPSGPFWHLEYSDIILLNKGDIMIQTVFATTWINSVNGNGLGFDGGLPWPRISRDMKNFALRTKDTTLIMGAKTFMSMPKLKGRKSYVITDRPSKIFSVDGFEPDEYVDVNLPSIGPAFTPTVAYFDIYKNVIEKIHKEVGDVSIIGGKLLIEVGILISDQVIHTQIVSNSIEPLKADVFIGQEYIDDLNYRFPKEEHYYYNCLDTFTVIETVLGELNEIN